MSDLRKAAQQALQLMRQVNPLGQFVPVSIIEASKILKAALAQPEQEPVAYQWLGTSVIRKRIPKTAEADAWQPLYTHPHQRKPLTIDEIMNVAPLLGSPVRFARAIEAAHGIGSEG